MSELRQGTKCVQAGYTPKNGEPRQVPIIQSTTFKYDSCEAMGKLFNLEASGYFYSRLQNPTNDHTASKIAELEGGVAAMLTSSGQAANFFAIFNICEAGGHLVCSSSIYGGTYNLIGVTLPKMGIEVSFVSPDATEEELNAAFKPNTKLVFGETLANPALSVLDIEKFAKAAHSHGVPLIVDNTFPTPINCQPIKWGADIVTHYATQFGKGGAYITKATVQLMRDLGSIQSPQNSFLVNLGLESLHVRMREHSKNGLAVAEFLAKHEKVQKVNYPGLKTDTYHSLAEKYMPNGCSGVVSFEIKGGREAAEKFMTSLKLIAIETHVADAKSCCLCPSITTHRQLSDEQLVEAGVSAGLVRVSLGIEDAEDLIEDIRQALEA